jgi:hypothetical protein
MIICPNCHHQEIAGAIFCSECGALLEGESEPITHSFETKTTNSLKDIFADLKTITPRSLPESGVGLCVIDTGQVISLTEREEFTMGRSAEGQPILPDIDLSQHKAYEYGVSRLHASIRITPNQIVITDLGSVNGTRINGQKIPSHKPCALNHGDILTLGKLKLQLLMRR